MLQGDITQFFPSIDHEILESTLARVIQDSETINLIEKIMASGIVVLSMEYQMHWFHGDDLWAINRPRGLSIGNLTSQFWANVYLNPFDHFVKRQLRCPAYIRYMDDFLLFGDDKKQLRTWQHAIIERMNRLRLTLHPLQFYPVRTGIPFLGFRIFPTHRRLKKRRGVAFQRRFRRLYNSWRDGEISRDQLDRSGRSWAAHAAWGDTWGLRLAILGQYDLSCRESCSTE